MPLNLDILKLPEVPEAAYRSRYLRADALRASVGISVVVFSILVFLFRDYQFLGLSGGFYALLVLRLLFAVYSAGMLVYLKKVENYRTYDRVVAIWMFIALSVNLIINHTRPPDYYLFVVMDAVYLSLIYIMLPIKLRSQVIAGFYFAVGDILILAITKDVSVRPALFTIIFSLVLANGLGIAVRQIIAHYRRDDFLSVERAEKALAEVKTLRGFIPICSSCKKIRDDKGYWQAVEQYVKEHSEAEFTHGICPDCMKKLYGEEMVPTPDEKP
jgi:hypothetical protein